MKIRKSGIIGFQEKCPALVSYGVDGNVNFEACRAVCQDGADVVLEEVPDVGELHDVARLLGKPELVEFNEEVAVEFVSL